MGFSKQTEGNFRLFGLPFSTRLRQKIGYLPEKISIPGFLTGEEFLTFSGKLAGMKNALIRDKSKSLLEKQVLQTRLLKKFPVTLRECYKD